MTAGDRSSGWRPRRAAIIGVGLLGGSVGLALRAAWPDVEVIGYARRPETLDAALRVGAATSGTTKLAGACLNCDLVVVSTPVNCVADHVVQAAEATPTGALVTDVGSTKAEIVRVVQRNPTARSKFVGSHPIAGGEKTGPEHARGDLFQRRQVVITPTEATDPERVRRVADLWSAIGATTITTTPEEHDEFLAATSHLPHLVAAALASIIPPEAFPFVGSGWRDTTRVAAGCPDLWSAICRENSAAISEQLRHMIETLQGLRRAVDSSDMGQIERLLRQGQENRMRADGGI